jgi:AhpD family alkylhydroperoxidase
MKNPLFVIPGAFQAQLALSKSAENANVPKATLCMVTLRASQINGCSVCVVMHAGELKELGESDERIHSVAAWREAPWFTEAERAALALTEALTRLSDRPDAVSDEIWEEAARHYDERGLAALVVTIAAINVWNRVNAATRQVAAVVADAA